MKFVPLSEVESDASEAAPAKAYKFVPLEAAPATSAIAARNRAEAQARQDEASKGAEQVSIPQAELADAERNVAALRRELTRKGADVGERPAVGSSKAGDFLLAQGAKAQGQKPADVVPPAPPVAQTQLAPPAPAVAPQLAPKPVVAGRFGASGAGPAAAARVVPPQLSALEKAPNIAPVVSETQAALNMAGVSPQYVASLKAEFYQLPPTRRVAALQQAIEANPPNTVKGRAVRAVAAEDEAWKAATSRISSARLLSPRLEDVAANIKARYPERPDDLILMDAQRAIAQGQSDIDYGSIQADKKTEARDKLRAEATAEKYTPLTAAKDIGLSAIKGTVGLAESVTGLADILSFGTVGKVLANSGYYDPKGAREFYTGLMSATSRDQAQNIEEAKGFVNSLKAAAVNPAALLNSVVESLPGTVAAGSGAGMLVRQLMTKAAAEATALKLTGEAATKFITDRVKAQTFKIATASGAGEGLLTAGSTAEAGRQAGKDWDTYVLPALAAGLGDVAIIMAGGKVAQKFGVGDVQTSIAARLAGLKGVGTGTGTPAVKVFKELAKEGFLEEMPQSYQEQIFQNLATGRPWNEGVDEAAAQGLITGIAMAGGHQASSQVLKATSSLAGKAQVKLGEAKEGLREPMSKILGVAKTNELLGFREGAYERPEYEGVSKVIAQLKRTPFASTSGTLNIPPTKLSDEFLSRQEQDRVEPGLKDLENVGIQEEKEPPLFAPPDPVKAEAQRKEAVTALANRIEQEQGIPIEDAERIAANDIAATEAHYRRIAGKGVDLTRMEEIARSHIVAGYSPPVAMEMAAKAVQEERAADALAKETGALDVRKPKSKTGRRGAGVAGESGVGTAAGPETTTRDGMVSTESDAGLAPTGEAPQPGALTETETEGTPSGTETVKTEQTETQGQEKPAAVGKPPKAPKPAKVEPAKGDVHTFEEAQENNALGKPVRTGYNLLINGEKVGTYKTKRQAVAASNLTKAEKTGNAELIAKNKKAYDDAIASTGAGRPPKLYPRQKPPTATAPAVESEEAKAKREMDEARAEAAAQEESDRKKAEDFETGTAPKAEGPITVVETQLLKGDALTGASTKVKLSDGSEHEINRQDSITSMGLPGWHDVNAVTINSYLADTKAEAIKELIRRQEEKRGAAKKPKGKKATSAAETLEAEAKEKLEELEDLLKNYNTNPDVASAKASAQRIYRIANDLGAPKAVRDRAKKILADEIDVKDIVTQNKDAIRASSAVLPGATPDAKFAEFKNASQAIAHVIRTGTKFQQALGNRLRGFVNGVKFVVVEKDQKVLEGLTGARIAKRWEKSIAMYVENYDTGERTVYVRGASFGNRQGLNNTTVLHELLHAATSRKLDLGLQAIKDGASRSTKLVRDTIKLVELMHSSGRLFNDLIKQGKATEGMRLLNAYGDVFSDPKEFLAYGMTDGDMQNFLIQAHGYEEDTPFFTRFVRALRDMFGMGENDTNALSDLIVVSDSILSTRVPVAQRTAGISLSSAADKEIKARPSLSEISEPGTEGVGELDDSTADDSDAEAAEPALRTQAQVDRDVKKAAHTFNESVKGHEFAKTISALQVAQDPRKFIPYLRALWKRATTAQRNVLVSLPTNEFLADWAGNSVPELTNTAKLMQQMSGMAERLLKAAGELTDEIDRTFRKNPDLRKKLDRITLMSTLAQVDPADPNVRVNSEVLDKQWRELGDDGRRLYKRIRDHFDTLSKYYTQLLDDQITKSGLDIAQQANLMKKIRAIYETGSKIVPYFPLMRDGEFWLAIGKGNGRKLFLFKTLEERDNAMQGFADERIVPRKPNESKAQFDKRRADNLQELLEDYDFEHGNNISSMRRASYGSSPMLGEVFAAIDSADLEDIDAKETIKDAVYQVYIQSMPEQSFRKMFMHRKGRAGFRPDILQNTAHASAQMASQLARIKYAPLLRSSLSAAKDSISNRPRYEPFVVEMQRRVALNLAPERQSNAAAIAGLLNKASFIYYLGGASSALLQPLSIIQTGMPVLARYGTFNASIQMAKMLKVWDKVGVYKQNADGTHSFVGPSMEHGALTPFQRKAFKAAEGRKLFASTYASAVFDYKSTPTEKLSSPAMKFAKGTVDTLVLGGLMHSTERMSREFIYFSSIDLQVAALKKAEEDLTPEETEKIIDQAVYDTNEALGNYGEYSRPLFMRSVGGKVLTQFMMYPLHVSLYLLKNFKEMIKPMNGRTRQEAFKKFFGTMLSTYVLGGYVALPMFSTLMGFIGAAFNALRDDDDEIPDWELYVREVLIPDMFEQITIAGKPLSYYLDPELAKTGALNYFTGADFSSRTQLNNLWLRDTKVHKTFKEDAMAFALEKAGPAANMIVAYGEGFEALFNGDYSKAMKKFAPAGFRNYVTAHELYTQGAKDSGGNQLLSKDAFSTGALIFQAVGFRSDALANLQYVNFTVMGIKQKIENERQQILNKLDRADREGDTPAYSKAYKEMEKFNDKHPELEVQISLDTLTASLEARRKQRAETWRGSRLEAAGTYDKYLSASRRKASEAEAEGRKK